MQAWEEFLQELEGEVGKGTVRKWLRTIRVLHFDAANLYLEAPDPFHHSWFEEHIRRRAKKSLLNANGLPIAIHLAIKAQDQGEQPPPRPKPAKPKSGAPPPFELAFDEPNDYSTFATFLPTKECQLAHHLLKELCTEPRGPASYNPIFLYSAQPSGKTHLLMATAKALKEKGCKALFVRCQTFTDHVVSAIRHGHMEEFRSAYRHADVLLVDDVHILENKRATQEELFHTFNTLHVQRKQVIFSAKHYPPDLRGVARRLISRFEWGVVLPLGPPTPEELQKILALKAKALGLELTPELTAFLITSFGEDLGSLARSLESLTLHHHLECSGPRRFALESAKLQLAPLLAAEARRALTPEKLIQRVGTKMGIAVKEIMGRSQKRNVSEGRQVAMYVCRHKLHMPYARIGSLFQRDHSTVMSSVRQIEKRVAEKESELPSLIRSIIQ